MCLFQVSTFGANMNLYPSLSSLCMYVYVHLSVSGLIAAVVFLIFLFSLCRGVPTCLCGSSLLRFSALLLVVVLHPRTHTHPHVIGNKLSNYTVLDLIVELDWIVSAGRRRTWTDLVGNVEYVRSVYK